MGGMIGKMRAAAAGLALGLGVVAGAAVAQAQTEQMVFDLVLKGFRAGTLSFTGTQNGRSYSAAGKLQSAGLVAMIRKVRYDATVQGSVANGRYVPNAYSENADTGRRQSQSVMTYSRGVPQVKSYSPPRAPRPTDVDPASMGGTVDPLTALYATLRDVEPGQECKVSLRMFDGVRSSQIYTANPKPVGVTVVCAGEYRRLAGFSDKEMAEKQRFAFTLTYVPTPEGRMRVNEVAMDSLYGKASLQRR